MFSPPCSAGRSIVCGFSWLQRIGKGACTDLWFSPSLYEEAAICAPRGKKPVFDAFKAEWAAVRQFELLQEAGNLAIEDLEFMDFKRAFHNLMKMRAGGYRVTVITLGRYDKSAGKDDLRILDARLQDEITRIIHMLYLEEQSALLTGERTALLDEGKWRYAETLPHVAMTLGSRALLSRESKNSNNRHETDELTKKLDQRRLTEEFFRILELLPQQHIAHSVAVGLALPEATKERNWIYLAKSEHQFSTYMRLFSDVFRAFDCVSLSRLHERAETSGEFAATMRHMRGYGDRLSHAAENRNRAAAAFLRNVI